MEGFLCTKIAQIRKDENEWEDYCEDDLEKESPVEVDANKYFKILDSRANIGVNSQNCTIKTLGYVGSENPDKSLASRRIEIDIYNDFIEGGGGSDPDWDYDEDDSPVTGRVVHDELSGDTAFATEVTFNGSFDLEFDTLGNLCIGNDVHANGAGSSNNADNIYIGNNFSLNGELNLGNVTGDVYFGTGVSGSGASGLTIKGNINGDLKFAESEPDVKIKATVEGEIVYDEGTDIPDPYEICVGSQIPMVSWKER